MDINYHYFAVKAIAVEAGFSDDEAQIIAKYSQFIDDFDLFKFILLKDVPDYAKYLVAMKLGSRYVFNPVTTGFNSWFDMAILSIERYQRLIAVPFHFIPAEKIRGGTKRLDLRVRPADINIPSSISALLNDAKNQFVSDGQSNRLKNTMRIGMLLHTFADTYAHQNFSGFHGWENYAYLDKVINNIDNADITNQYSPKIYHELYAVGHAEVNHAPDDTNVTFYMRAKLNEGDNYTFAYSRSNTREFLTVSKQILNYLRICLKKDPIDPIDDSKWADFSQKLVRGFLTTSKDPNTLSKHWQSIFDGINFHYNKAEVTKEMLPDRTELNTAPVNENSAGENILTENATELFFLFNVLADHTRNFIYADSAAINAYIAPLTENHTDTH